MEVIPLATAIKYGTPVFTFIVVVLAVYLVVKVKDICENIRDIKKGMVWADVYSVGKQDIDRRLDKLERKIFNGNGG